MKLMCSHEHVQSLLKAWAKSRNRKLVFAKHFFSNIGTSHQKSLPGMYRTLLHDILESCPDLTRSALPTLWAKARETPWQVGKKICVSDRDVHKAFDYVVGSCKTDNKLGFCFFVDGLDELILEMLEDQMSQARPNAPDSSSSVDPEHNQSQEVLLAPNGRIEKALQWRSTLARYSIAFVIGTMFGKLIGPSEVLE
ncbi:uncharacterized protein LY79DRAFT_518935 [Colletotrichum navitas]|uniref:Uncharacterized protein n=1 Tax=Colletotrichum navitas TaxID=681940 RepID=A0AAD8PVL1_9PEZI|nr:uncharacterized protein LY79DRAFT_518935 [Colletotrichum navitas]KAK1585297.1 hypothetical protein LY79DRAFT_518935 [Colletotrichum navitas]